MDLLSTNAEIAVQMPFFLMNDNYAALAEHIALPVTRPLQNKSQVRIRIQNQNSFVSLANEEICVLKQPMDSSISQ